MNNKNKKRIREFGITVGILPTGILNTIADVSGVTVGHCTKIEGSDVRTGITIIDPGIKNIFKNKIPAAIAIGNGFGKMTGIVQVEELGTLEAPITLTNTLAVGPVMRGVVDLVLQETQNIDPRTTINAVVGETNDGLLNAIHNDVVTKADVQKAFASRGKNFTMGNVGAGTGTRCFAWKGGIGSASRKIKIGAKKFTLGVLVQTNFGGSLTVCGVPIGQLLGKNNFNEFIADKGSCMIVVATDAPCSARQLKRIAKRTFFGLARTGSIMAHGSGDFAIAFSTDRSGVEGSGNMGRCIKDEDLTALFLATVEATEEAVYDAMFLAKTTIGRAGNRLEALPVERVVTMIENYTFNR